MTTVNQNILLPIDQAIDHAAQLLRQSEIEKAIAAFLDIEKRLPKSDHIKYCIGVCYKVAGQLDLSEPYFKQVIAINPKHVLAYFCLGEIYSKRSNPQKSLQFYQKVLELSPNDLGAMNNMAAIYNEIGENQESINIQERIIAIGGQCGQGLQ